MDVIVNIKQSKDVPARQQKAMDEFIEMLQVRAEAETNNEAELASHHLAGSAEGGV